MSLSSSVKERALRLGFTARHISLAADIPYSTLNKFLRGERSLDSNKLERVLKVLHFDLNYELNKPAPISNKTPSYINNYLNDIAGIYNG